MFKKVEDDVLLGVSKFVTRSSQETNSLLIEDDNTLDKSGEKLKNSIEDEEEKTYTLEELIDITNENEELIRSIIDKKNGSKSEKDKVLASDDSKEDKIEDDDREKTSSTKMINRDEYNVMKEELLSSLKDHISYLKNQIETKDQQLQNKDELIRNFQVLMKSDKDRIHELEDSKRENEKAEMDVEIEESLSKDGLVEKSSEDIFSSVDKESVEEINSAIKKRGFFNWFKK